MDNMDRNKYPIDIKSPIQGQVIGEGNNINQHFYLPHPQKPRIPVRRNPTFLDYATAIILGTFFSLIFFAVPTLIAYMIVTSLLSPNHDPAFFPNINVPVLILILIFTIPFSIIIGANVGRRIITIRN
jgi:hypothetical protein